MTKCQLDIVVENEDSEIVGNPLFLHTWLEDISLGLLKHIEADKKGTEIWKEYCLFCVSSAKNGHSITKVEIYRYQKYDNNKEQTGPKLELGANSSWA